MSVNTFYPLYENPPSNKLKEYSADERKKIVSFIENNNFDGLNNILKDGYDINFIFKSKYSGITSFTIVMFPNITKEMIEYLIEKGLDINFSYGNYRMNAIIYFAAIGRLDIVKYLWENIHIDINKELKDNAIRAAEFGEKYFDRFAFKVSNYHPKIVEYIKKYINPNEKMFIVNNPFAKAKIENNFNNTSDNGNKFINPLHRLKTAKGGKRRKITRKAKRKSLKKKRTMHKKY